MQKSTLYPDLAHTLSRLMLDRGLKEYDVVQATGLPQTTISSILKGKSKYPRPLTLRLLAELFGLTMEQLIGYESLATALPSSVSNRSPLTIPLIEWPEVKSWLSTQYNVKNYKVWLLNGVCKSPKAFALKAKPSMRSQFFSPSATLLIDPEAPIVDGLIFLVFLDQSNEPILRLITIEGKDTWLNSLEKGRPPAMLNTEHVIIGSVAEARFKPGIK